MKWEKGRQLDSFKMTLSAKDCVDILNGNHKRLFKNVIQMYKNYESSNLNFKKIKGRDFNTN